MEELFNAIANIGFPTAVSVYLLVRFETKISDLTSSLHSLEKALSLMLDMK